MSIDEKTPASSEDQTVFRNDATVLRVDTDRQTTSTDTGAGPATGAQTADTPKVLKQRFVLEEKIGSGGMGTVFRAKDLRKVEARDSQPYVAVKVLNNDFRKHPEAFIALEREASKSQSLRHSNIVSIFDFDKDADVPFITMELLEGEELADTLRHYPNGLPTEMAWSVIRGMVAGLDHAHTEGVVHADFKPGNIFITQTSNTKVLDFGIARAVRSNQVGEDTDFDPARLAALTPAYASREMLNGDNPEPRDDLYSLGVVIYMVLSGRHPFGRLPATEAAAEGLTPERPKGVGWRQWRTIQRCLDFNRQGRPQDAHEVMEGLFGRPPWQRISLAASVAILAVAAIVAVSFEPPDITEVRKEVRQQTLVQAQADRVEALLTEPVFDDVWPRRVLAELDTLRHLDFMHEANARLREQTEKIFRAYIRNEANLEEVVRLYALTEQHGEMALVGEELILRLRQEVTDLQQQAIDTQWLSAATRRLALIDELFPADEELKAVRAHLAERVRSELPQLLSAQTEVATEAWTLVEDSVADDQARAAAEQEVNKAVQATATAAAQREFAAARKLVQQRLDAQLNVSCLRLDMDRMAGELGSVLDAHRPFARQRIATRLRECHTRLSALDPTQAALLAERAESLLGRSGWQQKPEDPCAAQYLLGNGQQDDRAGFCVDRFAAGSGAELKGPKLVVVGDGEQKFAVSKYEISWRDFADFCQQTADCEAARDDAMPVTDLPVEVMEAYAAWLSEKTGYRYRLPTLMEWSMLAVGEPDPNRNCVIDVGGVRRGSAPLAVDQGSSNSFGLVHVLGNAREVVRADEGYAVVGGGFNDPIEECSANQLQTAVADVQTGFRLVREVS